MTCVCERRDVGDGELRIEWPAVECPVHGRAPGSSWRVGDPLRRHAKVIDRQTGAVLTAQEARAVLGGGVIYFERWEQRFRNETPYEVEQRLLAESRAREPEAVSPTEEEVRA